MLDAKPLLLIDDAQPQVLKFDVLLHQPVGADDDVDLAAAQLLQHLLLLARGAKAREDIHLDRESLHPVAEGLIVLPGQDGGRHQDGALLAVHHALEGRADGNLGLAEADVAAQQAVHRHRALHVGLDLLDAAQLVVGLVVGEAPLKVVLPVGVLPEGVALGGLALGVELNQLVGHVLDRLFDPGAGLGPLGGV